MRRGMFRRMALTNIRNSRRFYLPYLLTILLAAAMFCNMCGVSRNPAFTQEASVRSILEFGVWVLGIFSVVFVFFTNSFLMKRRKQELGLYYILGLEKRHVARILAWEVFYVALTGTFGGIAAGLLLDRLMFLVILKIADYADAVSYRIEPAVIPQTAAVFACIFALVLVYDVFSVRRASAVELLKSGRAGEREPRARWFIALVGLGCTGYGYYLANTVKTIPTALSVLFIAVLLVIAGTYCLFLCASIAVLKFVRRRKSYYYRTSHFVAVSGLIYRMKQNAVGLANICILSTGVLLVLSTTVCLYAGMGAITKTRYPKELNLSMSRTSREDDARIEDRIRECSEELGIPAEDLLVYRHLDVTFLLKDGELCADLGQDGIVSFDDVAAVSFFTADTYEGMTGEKLSLSDGEVAIFHRPGEIGDSLTVLDRTYTVAGELSDFPVRNDMEHIVEDWMQIVVKDDEALREIFRGQADRYELASEIQTDAEWNVEGGEEAARAFADAVTGAFTKKERSKYSVTVTNRYWFGDGMRAMYGSMLFLGVYLGILFLTATVLIIYYKQIIEGYEDRERFAIMQKVGMDRREVKRAVRSQMLILFYLPLGTALVHCAAAFHLMLKVMEGFYMNDARLFAAVAAVTAGVFCLGYVAVFALTSRAYCQIVSGG